MEKDQQALPRATYLVQHRIILRQAFQDSGFGNCHIATNWHFYRATDKRYFLLPLLLLSLLATITDPAFPLL